MNDRAQYQKGYNAGRAKLRRDFSAFERNRIREEFRSQVFCFALQGLLACPRQWETNGKAPENPREYVAIAWAFADQALEHFRAISLVKVEIDD